MVWEKEMITKTRLSFASYLGLYLSLFVAAFGNTLMDFIPLWMPEGGLDPSWSQALQVARERGFHFGSDIIFTYGPLGFLLSSFYHPGQIYFFIGFWSLINFLLIVSIFDFSQKNGASVFSSMVLSIGLIFFFPFHFFDIRIGSLFFVYVLRRNGMNRWEELGWISLFSILSLSKLSFLPFLVLACVPLVIKERKIKLRIFIENFFWSIFCFLVTWLILDQPINGIGTFILNSLEIISGYSMAMSSTTKMWYWELAIFLVYLCFLIVMDLTKYREGILFRWMLLGGGLFYFFKAGFVRHDEHVLIAYGGMAFLSCLFAIQFYFKKKLSLFSSVSIGLMGVFLFILCSFQRIDFKYGHFLSEKFGKIMHPGSFFDKENWDRGYLIGREKLLFSWPIHMLGKTIDLYPNDVSKVIDSRVNWKPRPVFQSYSAYTPRLLGINVDFLNLGDAPDFILFKVGAIDNRLATEDDSRSWLKIMTKYKLSPDVLDGYMVFQKDEELNWQVVREERKVVGWNSILEIPPLKENHLIWISAKIDLTFLGKIVNFIYKVPSLYMRILSSEGNFQKDFRVIPGILQEGFLLSPLIENNTDLESILKSRWGAVRKVKELKILPPIFVNWLFSKNIVYLIREIKIDKNLDQSN